MCLCHGPAPPLLTLPGIHIPLVSLVGKKISPGEEEKTAEGKIPVWGEGVG